MSPCSPFSPGGPCRQGWNLLNVTALRGGWYENKDLTQSIWGLSPYRHHGFNQSLVQQLELSNLKRPSICVMEKCIKILTGLPLFPGSLLQKKGSQDSHKEKKIGLDWFPLSVFSTCVIICLNMHHLYFLTLNSWSSSWGGGAQLGLKQIHSSKLKSWTSIPGVQWSQFLPSHQVHPENQKPHFFQWDQGKYKIFILKILYPPIKICFRLRKIMTPRRDCFS